MKTIESLIDEANAAGLWLNNLFQLRTYPAGDYGTPQLTGRWQANFHSAGGCYEFGTGDNAVAALEDAIRKCTEETRKIVRTPSEVAASRQAKADEIYKAMPTAVCIDPFS